MRPLLAPTAARCRDGAWRALVHRHIMPRAAQQRRVAVGRVGVDQTVTDQAWCADGHSEPSPCGVGDGGRMVFRAQRRVE